MNVRDGDQQEIGEKGELLQNRPMIQGKDVKNGSKLILRRDDHNNAILALAVELLLGMSGEKTTDLSGIYPKLPKRCVLVIIITILHLSLRFDFIRT